ncbi:AraC family transcriptional regulator [Streptomyces sp. NPDC002619]|uniref:AraC family transcriptional regulator n=1 Tax=Streptomyces sp. NPDC002619 TaxID=3364655 RepID=UPI0036CBC85A
MRQGPSATFAQGIPRSPYGRFVARTHDLDEARNISARTYYPHQLIALDRSAVDYTLEEIQLGPLTLGRLHYGTEIRIDCASLDTAYQVNAAQSGAVDAVCGGQEAVITPATAAVCNPIGSTQLRRWSADATLLGLKIDRAFLERQARALIGAELRAPVSFRMDVNLSDPHHAIWLQLLRVLEALLNDPEGNVLDVLGERLPEAVVSTMLLTLPNNYSESLNRAQDRWAPTAVRRVVQAIEEQPEHPWTAEQLAEVARTSVRSLQASFRRTHDRTLFTYLREVRLDRIHAELRRGHCQVSEIAAEYGFYNLGRFSGYYHARFGVHPSTTLHESRSGGQ